MLIGAIFVIIFLSVLILAHELGHFLAAKKFGLFIEEFGFGLPPKIFGKKIGETIYSVNWLPFGGFVKMLGENGESVEPRSFSSISIGRRAIIIVSGVLMNFIFGWLALSFVFMLGLPQAVIITETAKGSPAFDAGILAGDKIISVLNENQKIEGEILTVNSFIKFIDENRGKKISVEIKRDGETLNFSLAPRVSPPKGEGALGVGLVEGGMAKMGFFGAFWEGFKTAILSVKTIAVSIFSLLIKAFVGKASLEQVAGPVGIVKITAQAGTLGFAYILQLMALISLNLAVINIFPFPALDGGRLIFLAIEKIKGSPLNHKFEKIANAAGFALLIFLMLAITIKDIIKF